ncbi:MAG: hypothetical protein KKF12_08725 [Proteobacteria bacterium]|nr:hypothetical protein [Desulfobacula sp.]MBU4130890.1 hypothetical protein [Pseudomonadota bacterium]
MTQLVSLEFLIAVLFIIDVFLVILLMLFVKRVGHLKANSTVDGQIQARQNIREGQAVSESAREIMDMLEPLVMESRKAALSFDEQIREKRKLSKDLNDALDTRIISINLLLSRAKALQKKMEDRQQTIQQTVPVFKTVHAPFRESNVVDQQNQIIDLYYQNTDIDTIAEKLSIPKGEVQLVIDLKEKFVAMEQGR